MCVVTDPFPHEFPTQTFKDNRHAMKLLTTNPISTHLKKLLKSGSNTNRNIEKLENPRHLTSNHRASLTERTPNEKKAEQSGLGTYQTP